MTDDPRTPEPPTTPPSPPAAEGDAPPEAAVATLPTLPEPDAGAHDGARPPADTSALGDPRIVGGIAATAVAFDIVFRHPAASASTAVFFTMLSATLLASQRLRTRQARIAAALAPVFSGFTVVWSSPWLVPFDLLAAVGLLLVARLTADRPLIGRTGFRDVAAVPFLAIDDSIDAARMLVDAAGRHRSGWRRLRDVSVGLALGAPVLLVVAMLLASADESFRALFTSVGLSGFAGHVGFAVIGAFLGLTVLRRRASDEVLPVTDRPGPLGTVEAITILVGLVVIYALFVVAQVVTPSNPQDLFEARDAARQGFFQLLWAGAITLTTLLVLDHLVDLTAASARAAFRAASIAVSTLTLVVVAIAMHRLWTYSHDYGLTMLRLSSFVFAGWIGLVFVLWSVRSAGLAPTIRWFPWAVGSTALAVLAMVNVIDIEQRVVDFNLDRADTVDIAHLARLSDDGVARVADRLDAIGDPVLRAGIRDTLCRRDDVSTAGLDWNYARARAKASMDRICPP